MKPSQIRSLYLTLRENAEILDELDIPQIAQANIPHMDMIAVAEMLLDLARCIMMYKNLPEEKPQEVYPIERRFYLVKGGKK